MGKKRHAGFLNFVAASMDGKSAHYYQTHFYFGASVIALIVWIALSSTGMQKVFTRIGELQKLTDAMTLGQSVMQDYMESNKDSQQLGLYLSGMQEDEEKMSPVMRGFIVNISTIAGLLIFLGIMIYHHKATWQDNTIVIGVATMPLTIGMTISFLLFKWAGNINNENWFAIIYGCGIVVLLQAIMTSFITFYVNIHAALGLSGRKRYFTTTLAVLVCIGIFGYLSNLLK